ncbi:hypothetical protein G6F63_016826 [Rhizopus arrhizus]|nr:hypothetical protein G6F63_016826 [Rhizopus arrhizus]
MSLPAISRRPCGVISARGCWAAEILMLPSMISLWASSMACLTVSPTPLVASATLLPTVLSDGEEVPPQAISGRHSRVAGNRRNSFMVIPWTCLEEITCRAAG